MMTVENKATKKQPNADTTDQATQSAPEKVSASVMGQDEPMAKEHPRAPGALVWLTYPVVLIVVLLIGIALFAFFSNS